MNLSRIIDLSKVARATGTPGPMSTGEALTVALVLNRHDWLKDEGYTVAQALDRIDADTVQHLRAAERALQAEFGPGPLSVSMDDQLAKLSQDCIRRHDQILERAGCIGIKASEARAVRDRWIRECGSETLDGLKHGVAMMKKASANAAAGRSPLNDLQVKIAAELLQFACSVSQLRFGFDIERGAFHA